ncbi:MAG: hypothetical protein C0599_03060 [Salinivirgaceae bacterium]|nr:MAG: hypothetical protein C0599_03060 [Salinivirgaceae bacterium]
MTKLLTFLAVFFTALSLNAQSFDFYISDPDPAPDSLKFCMGETVTFTIDYQGWGWAEWYMCSEEPDLVGWSNFDKWEYVYPTDTTYTLTVDSEVYFWVKVSEDFNSSFSDVYHIRLNGEVPELVYSDTIFCEGSMLTVSSSVTGLGTGYYKWYKDDIEMAGQTDESIDITEPGTYYVSALSNETGCPDSYYTSDAVTFHYVKPSVSGEFKPDLSRVTLETSQDYTNYQWYESTTVDGTLNAISGADTYTYNATTTATDMYYAVEVTTDGGCTAMSDRALINDSLYSLPEIIEPAETFQCSDASVTLELVNQGYAAYQWYKNGSSMWGQTSSTLTVQNDWSGGSGTYTVMVKTGIDEITEFESNAIDLTFATKPSINIKDNATLCPNDTVTLEAKAGSSVPVGGYESYKWYFNDVNDFSSAVEISGATDSIIDIPVPEETRYYWVATTLNGCDDVSNSKNITEFSLNAPYLSVTPWDRLMCDGDTVKIKTFTTNVTYQWYFNGEPVDSANNQEFYTTEVGYYDLEITSTICEDADPVMNNDSVVLSYRVNPQFSVTPDGEVYGGDSTHLIFCKYENISLTLDDSTNFSSIQWMGKLFDPSSVTDEWEYIEGETNGVYSFVNGVDNDKLHFKVRVDSVMGSDEVCTGFTDYKTIDGWVFADPAIASYGNNELCEEGDSVMINLAFPGEWESYEWYRDGELVPDSNNDTLWPKLEGEYVIFAYPEKCPDIPHTSGVGPIVQIMPEAFIDMDDVALFANPYGNFGRVYDYVWYLNGEAIDMNTMGLDQHPGYILVEDVVPGSYEVEVSNPSGCIRYSEAFEVVGIGEAEAGIHIYPNPVNNTLNISLENISGINTIDVYTATGQLVETISDVQYSQSIDFSSQINGLFLIKVNYVNNSHSIYKVVKN